MAAARSVTGQDLHLETHNMEGGDPRHGVVRQGAPMRAVCGRRARWAGDGCRRRTSPLHGSVMERVLIFLSTDQGASSLPSLLSLGFISFSSRHVPLFMFVLQAYPLDPCGVGGDDAARVPPLLCVCVAGAIARAARGGGGAGQHPSPEHKAKRLP